MIFACSFCGTRRLQAGGDKELQRDESISHQRNDVDLFNGSEVIFSRTAEVQLNHSRSVDLQQGLLRQAVSLYRSSSGTGVF